MAILVMHGGTSFAGSNPSATNHGRVDGTAQTVRGGETTLTLAGLDRDSASSGVLSIGTGADTTGVDIGKSGADTTVKGNLIVDGTTTTIDSETVLIADNHLYINNCYETTSAQTGGLVVNYLPTGTVMTATATGVFTDASTTAGGTGPTVTVTDNTTFATGDIIQVCNTTNNDGIYEVDAYTGAGDSGDDGLIEIRSSVDGTARVEDFTQDDFTAETNTAATFIKVNVSIMRSGDDGVWETGSGSTTGITFNDISTTAGATLDAAYTSGRTIVQDLGPIIINGDTSTTGGALDINPDVLAETSHQIDVTWQAGAYTGTLGGINVDYATATSLTNAGTIPGITLAGATNAGGGDSIALVVDSGWDIGMDMDSSADFSGGVTNSAGEFLMSGGNMQFNDNIVLSMGTGDDASISYDATDLVMNITGGLNADMTTASNITATAANLTVETVTSGTLGLQSAGAFDIDGAAASTMSVASANLTIETTTSGNIELTSAGTIPITSGGTLAATYDANQSLVHAGRHQYDKGADVASGGTVTLGTDGNVFDITGTTTINEIAGTNWQNGSVVVLQFDGALTLTNNSGGTNDLILDGATNATTAAGDRFMFYFDGTDWIEISRTTVAGSAGANNTLDAAYDQGGAGSGRSITADSGAVEITDASAATNNFLDITFTTISSGSDIDGIQLTGATNGGAGDSYGISMDAGFDTAIQIAGVLDLDASATAADLTLATSDGGNTTLAIVSSNGGAGEGLIDMDASGDITVDSSAGAISLDAAGASNFTTSSGAMTVEGASALNLNSSTADSDIVMLAGTAGDRGQVSVGAAADTTQNRLEIFDGGGANLAAELVLHDENGDEYVMWVDTTGDLRILNVTDNGAKSGDTDAASEIVGTQGG